MSELGFLDFLDSVEARLDGVQDKWGITLKMARALALNPIGLIFLQFTIKKSAENNKPAR